MWTKMECKCHSEFHTKEISAGTWPPVLGVGSSGCVATKAMPQPASPGVGGGFQACCKASSRDNPSPSCVWDLKTVSSPGQRGTWATTSSVGQGYGLKQMKGALHSQGCWFNPIKLLLDWPIFTKNLSNESMALNLDDSCGWWTEKQTEEKD